MVNEVRLYRSDRRQIQRSIKGNALYKMELHIFLWSTMSIHQTAINLNEIGFKFEKTEGRIQRFRWTRDNKVIDISLWVACIHPVVIAMVETILPYMDACVCWYHDHSALSCVRVANTIQTMERYNDSIWLMVTTFPRELHPHASKIPKIYDINGFERTRLTQDIPSNMEKILKYHLARRRSVQ